MQWGEDPFCSLCTRVRQQRDPKGSQASAIVVLWPPPTAMEVAGARRQRHDAERDGAGHGVGRGPVASGGGGAAAGGGGPGWGRLGLRRRVASLGRHAYRVQQRVLEPDVLTDLVSLQAW